MSNQSRIGIPYMNEQLQKQQQDLHDAMLKSVQVEQTTGMQGIPMPYQLRSDGVITGILLLCFILISYALKNSKQYLAHHVRGLFQHRERASLFDEKPNTDSRYILIMFLISCVLTGIYLYHYFITSDKTLARIVPHSFILGTYTGLIFTFVLYKWCAYTFINWVFFDRERHQAWIESYFNILAGSGLLLFPVILLIIYFNIDFTTGNIFILIILLFAKILLFYKCIRNFFNYLHGFLHFILYFCALEIIPLILLWKGVIYLNKVWILNF
ncbi:DUF4271 domain-containing protein [uncultured Bacteroides sp.]|uniref:DUF4271 domain-containing protein n=1 Tax=uncultured Bacteroides sp. TaxID=162156 RepID=UPI002609A196|nr:DUF4271 domain-containing protein [uncultured Bacteroides sp.]